MRTSRARLAPLLLVALAVGPLRAQAPPPPGSAPRVPRGGVVDAPAPAPADEPAVPKADEAESAAAGTRAFVDLTNRYRFVELYTTREDQARPGLIGQYQVAIKETSREELDPADGAAPAADARPVPVAATRQTIFVERPAEVSSIGGVSAMIRRYDRSRATPDDADNAPGAAPLLDGLTIWYRPQPNDPPQLLSLSSGRRLREREFELASRQVFLPGLTAFLPTYAVRVGDTWRVTRKAVAALLGDIELRGDALAGKFVELRRSADGNTTVAVFTLNGRVGSQFATTAVNARLIFLFPTPADAPPGTVASPRPAREGVIEARGAITEVRMGRVNTGVLLGTSGRPRRYRSSQDLILERKLGVSGPDGLPLNLVKAPEATDENAWLTYVDPQGRFAFRHPQDLLPPDRFQFSVGRGGGSIYLAKTRPEGRDLVRVDISDQEQTPEALKALLADQWKRLTVEVLPGEEGWLPEADWPNLKVFRVEAALKLPGRGSQRSGRMHYDAYIARLGPKAHVMMIATTTRDVVAPFRRDVEQMLRTFRPAVEPGG